MSTPTDPLVVEIKKPGTTRSIRITRIGRGYQAEYMDKTDDGNPFCVSWQRLLGGMRGIRREVKRHAKAGHEIAWAPQVKHKGGSNV